MPRKKKTNKKNNQKAIKSTTITKKELETLIKYVKPSRVKKNEYLYEDGPSQKERIDIPVGQKIKKNTEEKKEFSKKEWEKLEIFQEDVLGREVIEEQNFEEEIKEKQSGEQQEEIIEGTSLNLDALKDDKMNLTFISKRRVKNNPKKKNDKKIINDPKKESYEDFEKEATYEPTKVSEGSKKAVAVLILIILLLGGFLAYHFVTFDHSEPRVETKIEEVVPENIVFLGDSITDFYDLDKYYEGYHVVNSGIGGNQTKDILDDMNGRVYQYNPSKIFILIGTNDLHDGKSVEEISDNIKQIVDEIVKNRPETKIYLESIYPVNKDINEVAVGTRTNSDITEINNLLEDFCEEKDINYVDIYNLLTDDDGNLSNEYSNDGLHLNDKGYEVVTDKIKEYL